MNLWSLEWWYLASICVCILPDTAHTKVQSLSVQKPWLQFTGGRTIITQENHRKRSIYEAAKAIAGMAAVRTLLKNTREIPSEKPLYRQYVKYGTFETAIADFYSIKPKNVRDLTEGFFIDFSQGRRLLGVAGDRRVRLLFEGDELSHGKPVIEILNDRKWPGANIDRVIYRTDVH